ncbi:MAG: DUF2188 domain-containing protein [Ignavibacteria bacterium]|nr:DUF2188 domain-containing protein [Ignavibacteria bacterium]
MTAKTKRTLKQLSKVAKNPSKTKLHVIPYTSKKWSVVPDHLDKIRKSFESKVKAVSFAKKYNNTDKVEIHKSDGTIDSIITVSK